MATYEQSYQGVGELLRADFLIAEMHRRAERVKVVAEATAPVGKASDGDTHPGRYKASFSVESGIREGKKPRAVGRVVNDSPEAFMVEWGNRNVPRHRTLGKALHGAGGE
jgi:hypothetical protein